MLEVPGYARRSGDDVLARAIIVALLVANTFLQKLSIPGTGGVLPLSLLVMFLVLGIGITFGRLLPLWRVAMAFMATAGILLACTGLSPGPSPSLSGVALIVVLLVPYAFAFRPGSLDPDFAIRIFIAFAGVFAALGIVQFLAQFVVGADRAFWLDYRLAGDAMVSGFNNLNETGYLSGIYKSNGVFLLEASFLNQFLCIAVLLEIGSRRRLWLLALLGGGIVATYSGTGLLMLAAIAPAYLLRERHLGLAGLAVIGALTVIAFGDAIGLKLFFDRAGEFSSDQSSAFARFLSIFFLLADFAWTNVGSVLFGRGAGSVSENFSLVSYAAFDPTWGKIMYEYGAVGFLAYFGFFVSRLLAPPGHGYLKAAILLQFLFLGGFASTTPVHIELLMLLYWPAAMRPAKTVMRALDGSGRRDPPSSALGQWGRPVAALP